MFQARFFFCSPYSLKALDKFCLISFCWRNQGSGWLTLKSHLLIRQLQAFLLSNNFQRFLHINQWPIAQKRVLTSFQRHRCRVVNGTDNHRDQRVLFFSRRLALLIIYKPVRKGCISCVHSQKPRLTLALYSDWLSRTDSVLLIALIRTNRDK